MSTERKLRGRGESGADDNLGLLANGSSGDWEVAVDETTSGPDRWFVQIESPAACCSFEIPSPAMVRATLKFLQGRAGPRSLRSEHPNDGGSLVIGKHSQFPVILFRDDEYTDRCFLAIGPDAALVRLSIAGKDLKDLTEALQQAADDIEDAD